MKNNYCINIGRIICIAFIIMLFSRCQNKKNIDNQPNVIFIIADDLADRLSCYGDSLIVFVSIQLVVPVEHLCFQGYILLKVVIHQIKAKALTMFCLIQSHFLPCYAKMVILQPVWVKFSIWAFRVILELQVLMIHQLGI